MEVTPVRLDESRCYQALVSRDRRFDGQFIAGITSTGIYCRPSCPAPVRPKRANVRVFATAAAAQQAGFRSCKRCRPDAAPGSAEWDLRGDLVGRAMRLIESGEVDRSGVAGLATKLHVSERHLHRTLMAELGAGPIALARAHRANLARVLLETTSLPITDTAFAAGFSSVRQFNDTIRAVYDRTPTELRRATSTPNQETDAGINLRLWLPAREPIEHAWMFSFLANHAIPGVTAGDETALRRRIRFRETAGSVEVTPRADQPGVWADFALENVGDLAPTIASVRRLFDLDADPAFIDEVLSRSDVIGRLRAERPGVRVPGSVNGFETAIGAIVGQQVSVAGARTLLGRIAGTAGPDGLFPSADELAAADLTNVGLTTRRIATIKAVSHAVSTNQLTLEPEADRHDTRSQLLAIPGIGPWTADVIAMRVLGDPDVMLAGDLVIKRRLAELGVSDTTTLAPWRSYAACTLWATRPA